MRDCAEIDKTIAAFASDHSLSKAEADSMYKGEVHLGMSVEEISCFGTLTLKSESADGQLFTFVGKHDAATQSAHVYVVDGKVTQVDHL